MTMISDDYIARVLDALPRSMPLRSQIALELRGHIAERVGHGAAEAEVLRQLGDPIALAESYLAADPLESAPFGLRVAAKLIDVLAVIVVLSPFALVAFQMLPAEAAPFLLALLLICGSFGFGIYTIASEYVIGQTAGKKLAGLRVVTERGTRISLGQSIVRQLPMFLQVYLIDGMFALFTDRRQRAFELLSKTRVVTSRNAV